MASLNGLRVEAEAWLEELGRARAQAAPGVAPLGAVDQAHREVVSPDTARAVGALLASSRVPEPELPRLRLLARFLEDASLQAAAREGRTALEASRWRSVPEAGLEAPLAEAEAELPETDERAARLQREAAVNRGWEALLSKAQRVQAELADGASALGAVSLPALLDARRDPAWKVLDTDGFLRATEDAYRDVLGWALGKVAPRLLPLPRGDPTLADLDRVRALPGYPGALAAADEALRAWAGRLPDSAERARNLRTRTVPAAAARAIPVDVPEQIELLLPAERTDAEAPRRLFWTGCALHLASVESEAPVEHRWMGDRAVVAASGWVVRGLLWHERWLRGALQVGRPGAREVARMEALVALATLRAEAALDPHRRAMASSGPTLQRLAEAAEAVSAALRVRVGRGRALGMVADLDVTRRQLRAAALASCLWAEADRRFDADEFRNPVAARWLVAIWSRGAPEAPEQMAPALCATPLGLERLGAELVAVLGA
ncbi:MAG TPA: hypothetical protein VMT11_02195 [Myxococcaceae bacterium]|nr:hypothetical protein [Myxococcaceae bacterium]